MPDAKQKVLVVDVPGLPAEELRRLLHERFDVVLTAPRPPAVQPDLDEHHASALLNAIGEGVCLATPDGRVTWANALVNALDEDVKSRLSVRCREAAAWFARHLEDARARRPRRYDIASSDEQRLYEVLISPILSPDTNTLTHVATVVRDVTAARRTQQMIDAIDQAGRELLRIDAEAIRSRDAIERLRILQSKVIASAHELLHFDHFAVRLLDPRTKKLELIMSFGLPPEAAELDIYASTEGNGIAGYVAVTGQGVVCRDALEDDRFLALVSGARSSLVVPLKLFDRTMGVLDVESLQPGAFDEDDLRFAEMFARYIAMALNQLDLLIVERGMTNQSATGRVEGEIAEPLEDIIKEAEVLRRAGNLDPALAQHLERIVTDVESIRRRMRACASGPQSLLGVERALQDRREDPVIKGRRILVADDALQIRRIIHDVLANRGAIVETCIDGSSAQQRIEAAAAEGRPFDAVISDIKMPDRNGYEVFSAARRACPDTAVILMTGFGYDPHHSIVRASQEGLQCVLFKPFQVERLLEEVRKALTKPA